VGAGGEAAIHAEHYRHRNLIHGEPGECLVVVGQTVVADGIAVTAQQLAGKWDKTQPRRLRGIASCIDAKALMYRQFRRMLLAE